MLHQGRVLFDQGRKCIQGRECMVKVCNQAPRREMDQTNAGGTRL